jgi:hypothetical protein
LSAHRSRSGLAVFPGPEASRASWPVDLACQSHSSPMSGYGPKTESSRRVIALPAACVVVRSAREEGDVFPTRDPRAARCMERSEIRRNLPDRLPSSSTTSDVDLVLDRIVLTLWNALLVPQGVMAHRLPGPAPQDRVHHLLRGHAHWRGRADPQEPRRPSGPAALPLEPSISSRSPPRGLVRLAHAALRAGVYVGRASVISSWPRPTGCCRES